PRTSTATEALSRPVAVTVSPSTTITTGRETDSPTAVSTLSISMTSPTTTFCCLLPLRTIAYTATHSPRRTRRSSQQLPKLRAPTSRGHQIDSLRNTQGGASNTEGQYYGRGCGSAKRALPLDSVPYFWEPTRPLVNACASPSSSPGRAPPTRRWGPPPPRR